MKFGDIATQTAIAALVAVASRGTSKLLATEDGDYNAQVRDYLYAALC